MRRLFIFSIIIILSLGVNAQSKENCNCCTDIHNQFDFWIGEWEVKNDTGKLLGMNTITKLQKNCLLREDWTSAGSQFTGTSYNYVDMSDSTWNQLWISNTGNILKLKGYSPGPGKMRMKSDIIQGNQGPYYNQISWVKQSDGSVIQLWEIHTPTGELINISFKGIYRKVRSGE